MARDAVLAQPLLGLVQQVLHDALARLVVDHEVHDVVALRGRVLRMEAGVEIEARPVLEEHIGVASPGDDFLEEVSRDVVGGQPALAVQGAGEAVLVLEAEDPALHVDFRVAGERPGGKKPLAGSWPAGSISIRSTAGGALRRGCGGTYGAPWCDRAPRPRGRAR